jgi:hypothetical protein
MKTVLLFALLLITSLSGPAAGGNQSVSGRVLDSKDGGIDGVAIQAYRDERAIGAPVISNKGDYRVEYPEGKPLDSIRYDHSDWYPAVIQDISGKNSHTIHKTLYRRGEKLTYLEANQVICDFERITELDKRNDQLRQNADHFRYKSAFDEIEKLPLSQDMRNRIKAIRDKYGI